MTEQNSNSRPFAPPLEHDGEAPEKMSFTDFFNDVIRLTSKVCEIPPEKMYEKVRKGENIMARFIAWKIIYDYTAGPNPDRAHRPIGLRRIGELFGGFDHATVLWGINKANLFIYGDGGMVPPRTRWKDAYDLIMEGLNDEGALGRIYEMNNDDLIFPFTTRGYVKAMDFLWDIGQLAARKKCKEDVIIFANKKINKYRS